MKNEPLITFKNICRDVLIEHIRPGGDTAIVSKSFTMLAGGTNIISALTAEIEVILDEWKSGNTLHPGFLVSVVSRIVYLSKIENIDPVKVVSELLPIGKCLVDVNLIDEDVENLKDSLDIVEGVFIMICLDAELYKTIMSEGEPNE